MRSHSVFLSLVCLLGSCLADLPKFPELELLPALPLDANLPVELLEDTWKEARQLYKEHVYQDFKNGTGSSRATRSLGAKSTPFADKYSEHSNVFEIYQELLTGRHNISKRQAAGTSNPSACPNPTGFACGNFANSRYRTFDGTCNNLNNGGWGSVNRPFVRLLQPAYDDGFNAPRGGFNSRLQNPRVISVTVHPDDPSVANRRITNMVPQFGQFLDHDITMTPNANSQCCANPNSNPADCWAINVQNDPFYQRTGQRCLDFTRSTPCNRNGVREQMNANTAYIDGSMIYGSNVQRANSLRSFSGGMLRTNPNFRGFVPFKSGVGLNSVQGDFAAGDDRINEMPALACMHNVWIMEHNRIASEFQRTTNWNDERIFQETRRIVIAELQQVTYNEYLPAILPQSTLTEYNLGVSTWTTYNQNVDASMTNAFATASYRFGHSLVIGLVQLYSARNQVIGSYNVADEYFQSRQVTRDNGQGYDMILRGLMRQNAPEMDRLVTTGVTNFLFKAQGSNFGSDLVARNIQRGRDHGLRSYNDYRVACGLSDISRQSWASVPAYVTSDGWAQASRVYSSPADIDLFVGGLIEAPVAGGLMGPTFTCLNALQFARTKDGDRYFFTHNLGTGFTGPQLNNIVQRRLGDIICDNSQQPDTQANVFLVEGSGNPTIPCGSGRPQLNLNLFI